MKERKLEKEIRVFISTLGNGGKQKQLNICKAHVLKMLKVNKPATVRSYLTSYRKALSQLDPYILRGLRLPPNEQLKEENKYKLKLSDQQKTNEAVHGLKEMIQMSKLLIKSKKWDEIAIGLSLLTGRRITEILKTAKFEDVGEKGAIYFEGQLKAKGEKQGYLIPTIGATSKQLVKALERLRKLLNTENLSPVQVNEKHSYRCRDLTKRYFSKFIGSDNSHRCTPHDLRAIYATYCNDNFKQKWQSTNSYLSSILGHSEQDLTVANSYQKFYLV